MFPVRIGRCGYNSSLLNFTFKSVAPTLFRLCSDDNKKSEKPKKKIKKKEEKSPSLYTSTVPSENDQSVAKKKINDLLNDFNVLKSYDSKEVEVPKFQKRQRNKDESDISIKSNNKFEKQLLSSLNNVAETLGQDKKQTKSELIQILDNFDLFRGKKKIKDTTNNKNTFVVTPEHKKLAEKVQSIAANASTINTRKHTHTEFEGFNNNLKSEALKIFTFHKPEEVCKVELKFWNKLQNDELNYLLKNPPRNYYEELIHWTEQGKLWHFPINNEQGMDEEAKVSFTEHVFLEEHLEPWCPKTGPLRHFMELVLVGLSKNPYLRVADKREHIYWFRDYFENKKKLLTEVGAFSISNK